MDIDPRWGDTASFDGRPVSEVLAERDVSSVLRFLRSRGFSRSRLAALTGLSETRVRQISQGRQRVTSYEVLEQQALDDGDAVRAVRLAQQARRDRQLPPRVLALCLVREAEGHASADDATASRRSIELALRLAAAPQDSADELGGHCTVDYVRASEARCRQLLGESEAAMRAYEVVLAGCPADGRLDEGMWRADLALAYLDEGEPQRAAEVGLSAVQVATATSSARTLRAVGRLLPRLRRNREVSAVPELTDAYRAALDAVTMSP